MGDYEVVKSRAFDSIWDAIERSDVAPRFKMRAQLMHALRRYIVENDLTPAIAAKRMGVAKSRIAALSCGEINAFDIEALLGMARAAGFKTVLHIS
jgi:predicted XRE-type DNA-binding protein